MDKFFRVLGFLFVVLAVVLVFREVLMPDLRGQHDYDALFDELVDSGLIGRSEFDDSSLMEMRVIVTTTVINAQFSRDLITKLVILSKKSPEEPIDIYLRTLGGWKDDVFSVINVMDTIDAPINVHALGGVHSAGLLILAAATGKRYVYEDTILGFHSNSSDEDELELERFQRFFKSRTKLPEKWIKDRSGEIFYFTAEKAIEYGIADEIVPARESTENK